MSKPRGDRGRPTTTTTHLEQILGGLLGVAVGDALGVPYEFKERSQMIKNPATGMIGWGTHQQPPGTWSDDTSMTMCLAESFCTTKGRYNLCDIAWRLVQWWEKGHWAARNAQVFDIGNTTRTALTRVSQILQQPNNSLERLEKQAYMGEVSENGNGSLMRILPLVWYLRDMPMLDQWRVIHQVSALTHRHPRSAMACHVYLKVAECLLQGQDKTKAYRRTRTDMFTFWVSSEFPPEEIKHFDRVIQQDITVFPVDTLTSSGYVIDSLEASLWCFLKTDTFKQAILTSVNLGQDTDTTGAITGGLAGIYYGHQDIPEEWLGSLARLRDIVDTAKDMALAFPPPNSRRTN